MSSRFASYSGIRKGRTWSLRLYRPRAIRRTRFRRRRRYYRPRTFYKGVRRVRRYRFIRRRKPRVRNLPSLTRRVTAQLQSIRLDAGLEDLYFSYWGQNYKAVPYNSNRTREDSFYSATCLMPEYTNKLQFVQTRTAQDKYGWPGYVEGDKLLVRQMKIIIGCNPTISFPDGASPSFGFQATKLSLKMRFILFTNRRQSDGALTIKTNLITWPNVQQQGPNVLDWAQMFSGGAMTNRGRYIDDHTGAFHIIYDKTTTHSLDRPIERIVNLPRRKLDLWKEANNDYLTVQSPVIMGCIIYQVNVPSYATGVQIADLPIIKLENYSTFVLDWVNTN